MSTERIDIYGGKATIKQNKFGVWQFRMWVSNEKRYYEKSLRTKRRAEAIDKAEEMYFDLQNELKDGRKLFSVSIAEAVAIYLEQGISKAKPFLSVKPPQPSVSNTTQQATPNSAVGSQLFTSKEISDIRNDYLQKQSELQPIKPQSQF